FPPPDQSRIPAQGTVVKLKISGSTRDGSIHSVLPVDERSLLTKVIKEMSQSIPEFWIGRFDVKFATIDALLRGEFKVMELNGASGEDLTAWDPSKSIFFCYGTLFRQIRRLFEIGTENRKRGF